MNTDCYGLGGAADQPLRFRFRYNECHVPVSRELGRVCFGIIILGVNWECQPIDTFDDKESVLDFARQKLAAMFPGAIVVLTLDKSIESFP